MESITTRTSNDGNELVIPLGSQQGKHPSLVPATSQLRLTGTATPMTLYLLERFGVSDEFYHELTQVRLLTLDAELCIYYYFALLCACIP